MRIRYSTSQYNGLLCWQTAWHYSGGAARESSDGYPTLWPKGCESAPFLDEGFWLHTEGIRDTVDVIEVGDDLCGVVNGAVIQLDRPQRDNVGLAHVFGRQRELFGIGEQGGINRIDGGGMSITHEGMDIGIGFSVGREPVDLSTEVMRVRLRSINAGIHAADDHRECFPLGAAERRVTMHERTVHLHRLAHDVSIKGHDPDDVPHASCPLMGFFEFALGGSCGFFVGKLFDIRHESSP